MTAYKEPRLWLALRLMDLPLNALGIDSATPQALVITEKQRVVCASAQAQAQGVLVGMNITTAQLLCQGASQCALQARNSTLELQALEQLAEQLYQFTPYIETYYCQTKPAAGLLLEVSRCLKLFSGIEALSQLIFTYLRTTLYRFEFGLAHTAKGAWLLSHQQYAITGTEDKQLFCARLNTIPVQYLYDFPQAVEMLEKTGFDTLGDIALQITAQSTSSFKKRFGHAFTETLCSIFAIEQNFQQNSLFEKPVNVYQPEEFFSENIQFDYPISQTGQLHWPIENMLHSLNTYLRKRQLECQQIEWQIYDIYRNREQLTVHCDNPQSHWQLLYDLTLIQLEQRQLPFEVDTLELHCKEARPIQNRSQTLAFDTRHKREGRSQNFAITAAKLKARLGDNAVFKISYCDSHLPETSNAKIPLSQTCQQQLPGTHRFALRPGWLFEAPLAIESRPQGLYWHGYLSLLAGPERIHGNWWDNPVARDYFLAQRHDHLRLWVFLDLHKNSWHLHGIFG